MSRLSSEEKGYPSKTLALIMPVKLFGVRGEPTTEQVVNLIEQAEMDYELIEPDSTMFGYEVMRAVTGTKRPPVLTVDGRAYRGLEGVQQFFASR